MEILKHMFPFEKWFRISKHQQEIALGYFTTYLKVRYITTRIFALYIIPKKKKSILNQITNNYRSKKEMKSFTYRVSSATQVYIPAFFYFVFFVFFSLDIHY